MNQVLCIDGCGEMGDPFQGFLCSQCIEERMFFKAAKLLNDQEKKEETTIDIPKRETIEEKRLKERPVSVLSQFAAVERVKYPEVVQREIEDFKRMMTNRRIAQGQLHRYMVSSNLGKYTDPAVWEKYQIGRPGEDYNSTATMLVQPKTTGAKGFWEEKKKKLQMSAALVAAELK